MLKYYWNPNDKELIVCNNGKVYQLMSDGNLDVTEQEFELLGDDIEVTKFQACRKLEELLSSSFDEDIERLINEF